MVQQAGQLGQLQLGEQQLQAQQQVARAQQAARQQEMTNIDRLGRLDMEAKKDLYDRELQFKKDETSRTLFNERQLMDYAARNARSDEEYKNYAQQADLLNRRNLQAMETAYKLIEEDLAQKWRVAEQKKDQAAQKQIADIRAEIAARMEREKARAANRASMIQAGGMIVGAAAGAAIPGGGPTAILIGSQMGGAGATILGSQG
jgi:hypothetical protein